MKKLLYALISLFTVSLFTGCIYANSLTNKIINDTISNAVNNSNSYEDHSTTQKQEVRIYSQNKQIQNITDKRGLIKYLQHMSPVFTEVVMLESSSSKLPSDATELYRYELWQEDLDSDLPLEERPLLLACESSLYKTQNKYLLLFKFNDSEKKDYAIISLDNSEAEYLINLAQGNINTIDNENDEISDNDFVLSIIESRNDITYEGIVSVGPRQKIDVLSASKDKVTYSTNDLKEIYDIMKAEQPSNWLYIESLPSDAYKICDIIRYSGSKHGLLDKNVLYEQFRDEIYMNKEGYYIFTNSIYFKFPNKAGEYFRKLSA